MAVRDLAISRGASILIFDPHKLEEIPEYNTRDMNSASTVAHIREMADSIKVNGNELFPPATICQEGDRVFIINGWCRRRAHIIAMEEGAPVKGIACLFTTRKKPEDVTLGILTSNDGLPLTALEKAKAVNRLIAFSWNPADIAAKTGWSVTTVNNLIALHDAPDEIIDMVNSGQVSATLATKLVKEKGCDGALDVLKDAVEVSKQAGKSKATAKDLSNIAAKKVPWRKYGPLCYNILKAIYETPVTDKPLLMNKIAEAGEVCAEIEELENK